MARGDGFSNRRLRTIRPKNKASSRCERMKFGHTRERRRQNLGALLARVVPRFGCQRWMPRQFAPRRHRATPDPRDRAPTTASLAVRTAGKAALDKSWSCVILSYDSLNMLFQLNYKSGKAVYLQLVDQVKAAAASGALHAGSPLPGIRPLAEELRVNRNTVAKAYSALESQGVIETIAGKGCFVLAN